MDVQIEESYGISLFVEHIDKFVIEQFSPTCSVCGEAITEKDIHCIRVDIPVSGKIERMHDTEDCFARYAISLAFFYNHKPDAEVIGSFLQ